jgi:hypothetical protein
MTYAKDVSSGKLPLTVAFAEEARAQDEQGVALPYYSTYTTECGSNRSMDDGPIKDEK